MENLTAPLKRIIEAAIRSPSGDNCQPWSFNLKSEQQLEITTEPKSADSFFDYNCEGTLLSLGAVVENARTQAANESLTTLVEYGEQTQGNVHTVTLTFSPAEEPSKRSQYSNAMLNRTVNRRPYIPARLTPPIIGALSKDSIAGVEVNFINSASEINRWSRLVYLADRIRYSHPKIHEELFSKIVYQTDPRENDGIGLEIDRLGAGPGAKLIMKSIEPWRRMQKLSRFGIDRVLAGHSRFLTHCSGALCLLTISQNNTENWIKAGQQMERIWINAHYNSYCTHPVTVALYLDHRYQTDGMKDFLPKHKPLLEEIRSELALLLGDKTGAILFRVGKGIAMKNTAIRMPFEKFMPDTQLPND